MYTTNSTVSSERKPISSKLIGATLAILGNVLISVAMNVQKHAHNQLAGTGKMYLKSLTWWIGMALMGLGEIGNFAAYGFAPASLVAPLGSSGVIMNAIIAVIFLKEKIRLRDVIGIVWAILGGYLIVSFSSYDETVLTATKIKYHLAQFSFIIYIIIEVNILIFILYLHYYKKYMNVITMLLQVALLGSFTVIASKALSSMIRLTFSGNNQLVYPIFYILTVILFISIVAQIKYLNEAMSAFDATVVMPVNFILFSISAILGGIVFYREYYHLSFMQVILCIFGAILSFLGVFLICGGRKKDDLDEKTGLLDDEGPITADTEVPLNNAVEMEPVKNE